MRWLKHLFQTPTFFFTCLGGASLGLMALGLPADPTAFLFLLLAGGGTGIALYELVQRKGQVWGWKGLRAALRAPDGLFVAGFLGHIPQFALALGIAFSWWLNT